MGRTDIMKKNIRGAVWAVPVFILLLGVSIVLALVFSLLRPVSAAVSAEEGTFTLVLDPGHGGIDGGAVSDDGSKESEINLAIALRTKSIAQFLGIPVVLTRCDDSCRTDYAGYSEREDLIRRTELINQTPGAVLISIHQNDFPTGQPSGPQVLYAATEGSELWGKRTHGNLLSALDPENRRVAAPVPARLYITSHVSCPAILVECGFMSNNFEVLKLNDEAYQRKIALVLVASLIQDPMPV